MTRQELVNKILKTIHEDGYYYEKYLDIGYKVTLPSNKTVLVVPKLQNTHGTAYYKTYWYDRMFREQGIDNLLFVWFGEGYERFVNKWSYQFDDKVKFLHISDFTSAQ